MLPIDDYASPEVKQGKEWMLKAVQAAYLDFQAQKHTMFAKNGGRYEENRLYSINKPPVRKFKQLRGLDPDATSSELAVDWTFRGPGPKMVNIAVEKILVNKYEPVAVPIDPTSRSEQQDYVDDLRAKMMIREGAQQTGMPEIANMPLFELNPGDPQNIEEMEIRQQAGEQFSRAVDMELLIQLAFFENKVPNVLRPKWIRDSVVVGASVYKDDLGPNGEPVAEYIDPGMFGCSYCEQSDFSDMLWAFHIKQVPVATLKQHFTTEEYERVKRYAERGGHAGFVLGKFGQNMRYIPPKPGHVVIMDFEMFTWDDINLATRTTKYGNLVTKRATREELLKAKDKRKYDYEPPKTAKSVLRAKWLPDTDLMYEFGSKPNQKREYADKTRIGGCRMSYNAFAAGMDKMMVTSMVDLLRPHMDDYFANNISIQNMVNRMVPNGFSFDLDGLENINMSLGGKNMTPEKLIKMFRRTGDHLHRGSGLTGQNGNGKAIEAVVNEDNGALMSLINRQQVFIQNMRDDTGLNEITDGSTPAPRTGVGLANLANVATNTALMPLVRQDEALQTELGYDMYLRTQQAIRLNPDYGGYVPGINKGTWKAVKADANMPKKQYAIMLEMRANDEMKAMLMQEFKETFALGLLDPSDLISLWNTHNLEQAQVMWAYKIKKNQERMAQEKQQGQMLQNEGAAAVAERAEKAKQKTAKIVGLMESRRELIQSRAGIWEANIKVTGAANPDAITALDAELAALDGMLADEAEQQVAMQGGTG